MSNCGGCKRCSHNILPVWRGYAGLSRERNTGHQWRLNSSQQLYRSGSVALMAVHTDSDLNCWRSESLCFWLLVVSMRLQFPTGWHWSSSHQCVPEVFWSRTILFSHYSHGYEGWNFSLASGSSFPSVYVCVWMRERRLSSLPSVSVTAARQHCHHLQLPSDWDDTERQWTEI